MKPMAFGYYLKTHSAWEWEERAAEINCCARKMADSLIVATFSKPTFWTTHFSVGTWEAFKTPPASRATLAALKEVGE